MVSFEENKRENSSLSTYPFLPHRYLWILANGLHKIQRVGVKMLKIEVPESLFRSPSPGSDRHISVIFETKDGRYGDDGSEQK